MQADSPHAPNKACWTDITWSQDPNEGLYTRDSALVLDNREPLAVPGYTHNFKKDSVGGDIRHAKGFRDVIELGQICDAEPGCIAFTSGGWLKNMLKPESSWTGLSAACDPNAGLFVKGGSAPGPAPAPAPAPVPAPVDEEAPKVPEKMGTWIPFYTWPSNKFDDLITSVENMDCLKGSFKAAVLIGPSSGPPNPAKDTLHRRYFARIANMSEWTTFGYVHVGYGSRPLGEVLAEIDTWLQKGADGFGDSVQGIWINQVAPAFNSTGEDYMGTILERIQFYGALSAMNPGRSIDCKMAAKASFVNFFEGTYETWLKTKPVCRCSDVTRCIASIHGYDGPATADDLAAVMAKARAGGFEATFVTDRAMPDHYDGLPSLWKAELEGLCKTTINA
ncbi:MAG: Spherulation-specific family 4-domain-containing protein [Monoraphidium minutum]|nr:MAG: Spherulation-specific family 4-domain-containing protein [Monoraphidium minutum]